MNYQTLKTEIETGPLAGLCAGQSDERIAEILNDLTSTMVGERFITARSILAELGAVTGAAILDKLETAAAQSSPLKWAMRFLTGETGIDIGHAGTRGQIAALQTAGVLTVDEAAGLLDMANRPASRAEIIGIGTVTAGDVSRALRGPY